MERMKVIILAVKFVSIVATKIIDKIFTAETTTPAATTPPAQQ